VGIRTLDELMIILTCTRQHLSLNLTPYFIVKSYAKYQHGGSYARGLKTFFVTSNRKWGYYAHYIEGTRVYNVRLLPIG